ncbi:MAG: sporulation protein YqfD [Oscillospiraceae bacterium]|nr:sporulation protein YqfD [Oscillospiraceae bacterium]
MKSYIVVSSFGSYNEEFVNELLKINIKVWNIKNKGGIIYFNISPYFYKKIARTAFDFGVRTRVESRHGAYFKLRGYKKRHGVFLGAVSFMGIIVLLSNFIWDVKVKGNENISAAQIIEIMENCGIKNGVNIKGYDKERAEIAIIIELDGLSTVNIERRGSRLHVNVSERLEVISPEIPITTPCNVVADRSGRIVETEVYRGRLVIEKDSGVNRGDIIVSGVVEDGAGNIILSHARAVIIAECEDNTEFFVPFVSTERKNNGKIEENNFIIFLGRSFPLFMFGGDSQDTFYTEETRAPRILGFPLPYRLKTEIYSHYDIVEVKIGQAEARERLKKQIETYMENFYEDGEIVSFDEKYITKEDGIAAEVKIIYRKNIATQRIIGVP